jgi:hypothetical protein
LLDHDSFSRLAGLNKKGELIGGTESINGQEVCIIAINSKQLLN